MKKILALFLLMSPMAFADVGVGVILGAPTGISAIFGLSPAHSIDAALAWDLHDDHVHLHGDYLFTDTPDIHLDNVRLPWYYGLGARLVLLDNNNKHDDDFLLGVRAPIGIHYTFTKPKIELFAELAVILNLLQSTDVDIDGGIGARLHF